MAKAVRYEVRCTICDEVFQNDYITKHTKSKHKDMYVSGRHVPTAIVIEETLARQRTMDSFIAPSAPSSKKRRTNSTQSLATKELSGEIETGGSSIQSEGE